MTSLLLVANAALGVLASFIAASLSASADPWPACYVWFPVMQLASVPGFIVVPVLGLLFLIVVALAVWVAIAPTPERKKAAVVLGHVFLASVFLIPSVFELFGEYIGP